MCQRRFSKHYTFVSSKSAFVGYTNEKYVKLFISSNALIYKTYKYFFVLSYVPVWVFKKQNNFFILHNSIIIFRQFLHFPLRINQQQHLNCMDNKYIHSVTIVWNNNSTKNRYDFKWRITMILFVEKAFFEKIKTKLTHFPQSVRKSSGLHSYSFSTL